MDLPTPRLGAKNLPLPATKLHFRGIPEEVNERLREGEDIELVLSNLRARGLNMVDTHFVLSRATDWAFNDIKNLLLSSATWSDLAETNAAWQDALEQAFVTYVEERER